jgi:hypothetical protein
MASQRYKDAITAILVEYLDSGMTAEQAVERIAAVRPDCGICGEQAAVDVECATCRRWVERRD